MHTLFLQAAPPSQMSSSPAMPLVWLFLAIIPVVMIIAGMVLGFRALKDIRISGGALGGAMTATFAAGLIPSLFIVVACCVPLTLLGHELTPAGQPRSDIWRTVGCGIGVWLSFLMMRAMHRTATGWTPPARIAPAVPGLSMLATAAIVLTIAGAAVMLLVLVLPERLHFVVSSRKGVMLLDLPVVISGLVCGVLSYRETAGKTCSWICGSLFAGLLLLFAA